MYYFTSNLTLLVTSLKKVTNYILKDFNELNYLSLSSNDSSFAQKSFKFIESKIIEDVKKIKPDYSYILSSGETIDNKDKSNYIVISNITGFNNFKKGIPFFALSLALIRDNQEVASVVYQPFLDNLFMAEKNKGAFFNKYRLKSNYSNLDIKKLTIATNNPLLLPSNLHQSSFFNGKCPSLELCYLTSLKLDLCFYTIPLNYFEILPALIIANEAGFKVSYIKSKHIITNLIVGNALIRENLKL